MDHPRWSQATERRIGELSRRKTLPFNGYADEVASLYAGMDLRAQLLDAPTGQCRTSARDAPSAALAEAGHLPRRAGAARLDRAARAERRAERQPDRRGRERARADRADLSGGQPGLHAGPALFGWTWPARVRRELGLFAFFYASLHFLIYVLLDQGAGPGARSSTTSPSGRSSPSASLALVLLMPLALTSTTASVRRLGFRRWQRLHQLAYVAGVLAVIHFIWRVKIDVSQPLIYAGGAGRAAA